MSEKLSLVKIKDVFRPAAKSDMELMNKFKEQAQRFGTEIVEYKEVKKVVAQGKDSSVQADSGQYDAGVLIVASGSIPKKLNVPGEEEFRGKGVSYCATCDGPLFKDKDIAVIGCGNSGLQEGEALLKHVKNLTFIEFLPQMTATKILQERLQKEKKVRFLLNHMLTAIEGETFVESIKIKNRQNNDEKTLKVSGIFIYAGFIPNTKFLQGVVQLDNSGYIITNENMQTRVPGIYAVGDVRSKKVRQIDVACGEGTTAAISARDYIKEISQ